MRITDGPLRWARTDPTHPALEQGERRLTYGELDAWVGRVAGAVRAAAAPAEGAYIGVDCRGAFAFYPAFLGIVEAGGVAVPLSEAWTESERGAALAACDARFTLDTSEWDGLGTASTPAPPRSPEPPRGPRRSSAPFYVGLTSGSAGAPKGVLRSHDAWLKSFLAMSLEFGIGRRHAVLVPGSPYFSFSLIAGLHTLFVGGLLALPNEPGPAGVVRALARPRLDRPLALYVLPSVLADVTRLAGRRGQAFPGVETIITAGEKLQSAARDDAALTFPRARLYEYYGASELGYVTLLRPDEYDAHRGSVGRPFLGADVAVLDEHGAPMPAGEIGLLCARTEYGFTRYVGPGAGHGVDYHGWQTAGDLAWQDADGFVYLAGRRDNMLVIRGENVYPEAVERILEAMPGVRRAAVVAAGPPDRLRLAAVVEAGPGALTPRSVLAYARSHLSGQKLPRRVIVVDRLPTTPTGKLDRQAATRLVAPHP